MRLIIVFFISLVLSNSVENKLADNLNEAVDAETIEEN